MKCFVIMPFGSGSDDLDRKRKLDQIYSAWIKPAVESVAIPGRETGKLTCHRADMEVRPGDIIANIVEHLVTSDIVIADLTGHFYQCNVVGNSFFGRFRWFDQPISGYAFVKVESGNQASGGWWHSEDVPSEIRRDISRIDDSLPSMRATIWRRNRRRKKFPKWAEEYFENQVYLREPK